MVVGRTFREVTVRWLYRAGWAALVLWIVVAAFLRIGPTETGPTITIVALDGTQRTVPLAEMKGLPRLSRHGVYQNQYDNWRDEGLYAGVLLADLIGRGAVYASVRVVAEDGYEILIERARVEDDAFPMTLAYAFDGEEIPDWDDGPRIAVLPESGRVSNEAYGVVSAGSYWVKNVVRIVLEAVPSSSPTEGSGGT